MRKLAVALALIMMLGASGCNSKTNSEGDPSITQSSSIRIESTQSSSTISQQSTPASSTTSSETSAASTTNSPDSNDSSSTQSPPDSDQGSVNSEPVSSENESVVPSNSAKEEVSEPMVSSKPYTRDTRISDVINDPIFGKYGRLIFPVDEGYYSGETLGDLRLTWYNNIDPDKTVEIANYMRSHAESGDVIFYDIYSDSEKAADPWKKDTGLFFFKGEPGAKFVICSAGCSNGNSDSKENDSSGNSSSNSSTSSSTSSESSGQSSENSTNISTGEQTPTASSDNENTRILIAYFTVPEDDVDTVARASVVVKDGEKFGNTEYVANVIQQAIGGDLFQIEAVQEYTHDHDALTDFAADEKADNARPELKNHIVDISKYDTIILGYPNWWADLPMPVYTFLEEYDFGAKTIIPFVTHGGSGFSNTRKTISDLQPGAFVSDNSLNLSRNDLLGNEDEITDWAKSLDINTSVPLSSAPSTDGNTVLTAAADAHNSQTLYLWEEGNAPRNYRVHHE